MMTLIRQRYPKVCLDLCLHVISPTYLDLNFYQWRMSIWLVASATGIMEMLPESVVLCCVCTDHLFVGYFNHVALEKAKIVCNFGLSECNRVKHCFVSVIMVWSRDVVFCLTVFRLRMSIIVYVHFRCQFPSGHAVLEWRRTDVGAM